MDTQIARIFRHALKEHKAQKIKALVFVGDALEENADELCNLAGSLAFSIYLFSCSKKVAIVLSCRPLNRLHS